MLFLPLVDGTCYMTFTDNPTHTLERVQSGCGGSQFVGGERDGIELFRFQRERWPSCSELEALGSDTGEVQAAVKARRALLAGRQRTMVEARLLVLAGHLARAAGWTLSQSEVAQSHWARRADAVWSLADVLEPATCDLLHKAAWRADIARFTGLLEFVEHRRLRLPFDKGARAPAEAYSRAAMVEVEDHVGFHLLCGFEMPHDIRKVWINAAMLGMVASPHLH